MEDIKAQALAKFLGCDIEDIEPAEKKHIYKTAEGVEYYVLTDFQADNIFSDMFDDFVHENVFCQIPDHLHFYFDRELYKKDFLINETRGSLMALDGQEICQEIGGETFYIYLISE